MAKVCKKWFPKGTFPYQKDDGFYMDSTLKLQLDALIMNVVNDWDFTIIISGRGEVRVGKSTLAAQIATYWAYEMLRVHGKKVKLDLKTNFVFDGTKLIEQGNYLGQNFPYSPLIYDEAGADLMGRKIMKAATQQVLDYFRECGQYNMLNILVIPEYFDLPKAIAVNRSKCLIDVSYNADDDGIFQRGIFRFYSQPNKISLYIKGKRDLNYNAYRYDFHGEFPSFFPLDEKEYKQIKKDILKGRGGLNQDKIMIQRNALFYLLNRTVGWTQQEISDKLLGVSGYEVTQNTISDSISIFPLRK